MKSFNIEAVQFNIRKIFAMPEREQAAAWDRVIEISNEFIDDGNAVRDNTHARDIYISIAKEAKYFA